ncbi:hypothetical protein ANN_15915 [Periplaneta americana]|uniref:Uncharacterized protein n=1 Tax=Periplaneta americana TaxID=6978 RepID=A0ABQ8SJH3_PERAM|nr:hypothetical protein ANN_15915 [Periplaneta americana]
MRITTPHPYCKPFKVHIWCRRLKTDSKSGHNKFNLTTAARSYLCSGEVREASLDDGINTGFFKKCKSIIRYALIFWGNGTKIGSVLILQKKTSLLCRTLGNNAIGKLIYTTDFIWVNDEQSRGLTAKLSFVRYRLLGGGGRSPIRVELISFSKFCSCNVTVEEKSAVLGKSDTSQFPQTFFDNLLTTYGTSARLEKNTYLEGDERRRKKEEEEEMYDYGRIFEWMSDDRIRIGNS